VAGARGAKTNGSSLTSKLSLAKRLCTAMWYVQWITPLISRGLGWRRRCATKVGGHPHGKSNCPKKRVVEVRRRSDQYVSGARSERTLLGESGCMAGTIFGPRWAGLGQRQDFLDSKLLRMLRPLGRKRCSAMMTWLLPRNTPCPCCSFTRCGSSASARCDTLYHGLLQIDLRLLTCQSPSLSRSRMLPYRSTFAMTACGTDLGDAWKTADRY
jgi:hypothetical protein